jgi:zinc protease
MRRLLRSTLLLAVWISPAAAVGPAVVERALGNGATLLVSEQRTLPIVTVVAVLDAGSRRDPLELPGLANLTAETLTEGAGGRSANEIAAAIEFIGGSLSASAGVDYSTLTLTVLRKDLATGLELFSQVLLEPAFLDDELARAAESTLAALRAAEDNPTEVAGKAFSRSLYGDHPYAHPVEGDAESVPRVDRAAVERFYRSHYGPQRAAVVVVGDVATDEIAERLSAALRTWNLRDVEPLRSAPVDADSSRRIDIDRPVTQASIVLGHSGIARSNPDFEAIQVMNYVLGGGGFSSRLMEKIRNQSGLVYGVSSYFSGGELPGSFRIIMQTKNESVARAIELAQSEMSGVRDGGVTEVELEDAKRYLTGSFPLSLDSNAKIATFVAQSWFFGLGLDAAEQYLRKVEAVTLEDVARVAREYLHPDALLTVVVADLAKTRPAEPAAAQ